MQNKLVFLTLSALLAISCNERSSDKPPASDSIFLEAKPAAPIKRTETANTWHALVAPVKGSKNQQFVVTGMVYAKDSATKLSLTRKKAGGAINLSELVLTLSAEPAFNGKLVEVRYEEQLTRPDKYQKVTIMHQKKTVATIAAIENMPAR